MENEKKIQIKIDGNTCSINYPDESQILKSKISGQSSLCASLTNIEDLTLTISKTTEDFINNNSININKKNIKSYNINSNEKSKLEITNVSVFNSDKKNETSSYKKTPINQFNNIQNIDEKNNNNSNSNKMYEKDLKDSVIKKLNFDLCDSVKETETVKNKQEESKSSFTDNISKNLNERYFMHEKNINNNNNNSIIITNNNENENNKSNNIATNSFEIINKNENENSNGKYITVNKSLKYFKNRCKSFNKDRKINNRISVDSNGSSQYNKNINQENSAKNIIVNINNNLFQNNSNSKITVNKSNFIINEHININSNTNLYNDYIEKKEKLKMYFDKYYESKCSIKTSNLKLKAGNNLFQLKKEQKLNQLIKIEENSEIEEKSNNNNNNLISNKDYILKTNKKLFPQLSSANSFNNSNSKKKLGMVQLSSTKKNYYFQTPSTSNIKGGNSTTSTKKSTFSSDLNSPIISISSNKTGSAPRIDNKDIITKLYYNNSSSKDIIHNKENENLNNNKMKRKKSDFIVDREIEAVKYFLKKHNTDLKNVMRINNKKIQTLLNGKNINHTHFFNNNTVNKFNEINEFKQFIQKNQFDKELLKTIKKKGSFH